MGQSRYPSVRIRITDGNREAFCIVGRLESALRAAGVDEVEIDRVMKKAVSGDYINLLRTVAEVAEVE